MKADRLQLRIDDASKRHLEQAAAAAHLSLSAFVLQAAQQRADEVLADRALVHLPPRAAQNFLDALDRPATASPALRDALAGPVDVTWAD
ncbi:type II toxin -antitoxin system TacA 1-like antitoxin [Frankia sp. CiP1_Cm_nod1]|uniref:type II toxin -antitoxin system TacA 1-like antitoxin n=1 Tax=Frankia sp. CiP1_Cm_nod1 TaxID=2897160 RepID=UPI002024C6CA